MLTYVLLAILFILSLAIVILIIKLTRGQNGLLLNQKIDSLKDDFTKNILQAQSNSLQVSKDLLAELSKLYEKIGGLDIETGEILSLTKSFHDILKPTKARGVLGESILEVLLYDALPADVIFRQYAFRNGKKVDFAIKLPQGLVPVDAKFSLETFKSYVDSPPAAAEHERHKKIFTDSVKKRIEETAGYIFSDEGTTDFALMYVPSEAVYYSIITETSLLDFAHQKRVFLVGPHTLYVYLRTILIGFHALTIEKRAKEIYNKLQQLNADVKLLTEDYAVLGTHLRNASLKYDDTRKKLEGVGDKIANMGKD
ncbi:MAG: DNA recombination protein RmuC [Candidatus Omnitrophica bacterium]|nr:DNA recombination protein RmuC [Candidatus Omnitrophota bacterium]